MSRGGVDPPPPPTPSLSWGSCISLSRDYMFWRKKRAGVPWASFQCHVFLDPGTVSCQTLLEPLTSALALSWVTV